MQGQNMLHHTTKFILHCFQTSSQANELLQFPVDFKRRGWNSCFIFHRSFFFNGMPQLDHAPSYSCVTVALQSPSPAHCTLRCRLDPQARDPGVRKQQRQISNIYTQKIQCKSSFSPLFVFFSNWSHISSFSSGLFRTLWPRNRSEFTHYDLVIGTWRLK